MKTTLDLRPARHRVEQRIRAHVVLCWLALLLVRVAETSASDTWRNLRRELQRLQLGTFTGPAGTIRQRTEPTAAQQAILRALDVEPPPRFLDIDPTPLQPTRHYTPPDAPSHHRWSTTTSMPSPALQL